MANISSFFQQHGLSINISDPLVWPENERAHLGNVAQAAESYSHEIRAGAGFYKASISLNVNRANVSDWLMRGLGRHVEVHDAGLALVFEGFVDTVKLNYGGLTIMRGPLHNVLNRADLVFSTIDSTADPPAIGDRMRLSDILGAYIEDAALQAVYGIWCKVFSTGGIAEDAEPRRIVDACVADERNPETSQTFRSGGGGGASLAIDIEGYWRWMEAYPYNNLTGGDVAVSTKLQQVLAADPNGIFSIDYDHIQTNSFQVSQWEDEDRKAWTVVKGLLDYGGDNDESYSFGIYEDRKAHYEIMTTETDYVQRLGDKSQEVTTEQGRLIYPWQMRPARWLFYADILTGLTEPVTLAQRREDPRYEFIESITYTAPWGLAHNGKKMGTAKQVLSKYGLTGVSG